MVWGAELHSEEWVPVSKCTASQDGAGRVLGPARSLATPTDQTTPWPPPRSGWTGRSPRVRTRRGEGCGTRGVGRSLATRTSAWLGLIRFDGHPRSGVHPREDVHHGEHGEEEATPSPL